MKGISGKGGKMELDEIVCRAEPGGVSCHFGDHQVRINRAPPPMGERPNTGFLGIGIGLSVGSSRVGLQEKFN